MGAKASVAAPIEPARQATDGRARGRHEVPPGWPLTKCTNDQAASHERGYTPGGQDPDEGGLRGVVEAGKRTGGSVSSRFAEDPRKWIRLALAGDRWLDSMSSRFWHPDDMRLELRKALGLG